MARIRARSPWSSIINMRLFILPGSLCSFVYRKNVTKASRRRKRRHRDGEAEQARRRNRTDRRGSPGSRGQLGCVPEVPARSRGAEPLKGMDDRRPGLSFCREERGDVSGHSSFNSLQRLVRDMPSTSAVFDRFPP